MPGKISRFVIPNGEKLKSLRIKKNWSMEKLVSECVERDLPITSISTVAKVEKGKKRVSQATVEALSEVYDTPYDELVLPEFRRRAVLEGRDPVMQDLIVTNIKTDVIT